MAQDADSKGTKVGRFMDRIKSARDKENKKSKVTEKKIYGRFEKMKCFPEVRNMIMAGVPIGVISRFIQEDRKEMLDIDLMSVKKKVQRYIKSMPPAEVIEERLPLYYQSVLGSIGEQLDEMEALSNLFHLQFDRTMIDYKTEKTIGKCLDSNTKNIGVCADIANKIGALKGRMFGKNKIPDPIQQMGVSEQNRLFVDERLKKIGEKYGEKMRAIAEDPAKRRRLLGIFEKISKVGDDKFLQILDKYKAKMAEESAPILDPDGNTVIDIVEGSGAEKPKQV